MKITVLGAGAWGTALAKVLHENGNAVTLWDIATDTLKEIQGGRSECYLPGVKLPADWKAEPNFQKAAIHCYVRILTSTYCSSSSRSRSIISHRDNSSNSEFRFKDSVNTVASVRDFLLLIANRPGRLTDHEH